MQKPRALPRTSLGASQFRVQMTPIFSFTNCFSILGRWDYVRLAQRLFKSTRVRLRNEIVFWQVSYVCEWPRRNFTGPKNQQRKSARAGGRVLKNLSRVKWKSVARERPRSRSRENRRLPISDSNRRRQNVPSRCGQCVRHSKHAAFPYYPGLP